MPGNLEIKAKIEDVEGIRLKARAIAEQFFRLEQCDTFFEVKTDSRLKLRFEKNRDTGIKSAFLISYQRPDVTGPKFSKYVMTPVSDTETMTAVLHMSNGMLGKVEKLRDVYIVQRNSLKARVHVDDVNQLGSYLEFEIIISRDDQLPEAEEFAKYLSTYFEIRETDHIPGAYWNLLQAKSVPHQ